MPFLAAIGIAVGITIIALLQDWQQQRTAAYNAAHKQYEASKRPLPKGATVHYDRGIPDAKAYREEWRSEYDLQAQRDMAQWTLYMLYASAIGVMAAIIGVIYVAGTLKATRDTVEVTREIGMAQTRAYVRIKQASIFFFPDNGRPLIDITAANSGQSPAREFTWNPIVQYLMEEEILAEGTIDRDWESEPGPGIPSGDETSMITDPLENIPLVPHIKFLNGGPGETPVVRLRIDFAYIDVFDARMKDAAYFAGVVVPRSDKDAPRTGLVQDDWLCKLRPINKPKNWDSEQTGETT